MSEMKVKSITSNCVLETFFLYVSSLWELHRDDLPLHMVVYTMGTSQSTAALPESIFKETVNLSYEKILINLFNHRFHRMISRT